MSRGEDAVQASLLLNDDGENRRSRWGYRWASASIFVLGGPLA